MADQLTETIASQIEGRSIRILRLDEIKRRMYAADDDRLGFRHRFPHLERVAGMAMPGAPDEAWRRIDFSSFPIDDLAITSPRITVGGAGNAGDDAAFQEFAQRSAELASRRSGRIRDRANDLRDNRLKSINEALATRPVLLRIDGDSASSIVTIETGEEASGDTSETGGLFLPQILIHASKASRGHVVIVVRGSGTSIGRTKVVVEPGASLRVSTIIVGGTRFQHDLALVDEEAELHSGYIVSDGDPAMVEGVVSLAGRAASATVNGLSTVSGDRFTGQKLSVEHVAAETRSSTRWHSLLRDSSRSLFVGNIAIPQGSKASSGVEESHSLLLSETARAESIPQLEIIENDVECSHGATVAGLDPETVYYLRSRGVPMSRVERLLSSAFCRQIIDAMELPPEALTLAKEAMSDEVDISDSH